MHNYIHRPTHNDIEASMHLHMYLILYIHTHTLIQILILLYGVKINTHDYGCA